MFIRQGELAKSGSQASRALASDVELAGGRRTRTWAKTFSRKIGHRELKLAMPPTTIPHQEGTIQLSEDGIQTFELKTAPSY